MRITAQAKQRTRTRILEVAAELLSARPLADVTTRDVAERTGIAHGTLFNYFPTKEALGLCLCCEEFERAAAVAAARADATASLGESLFSLAAEVLTRLSPYRSWAGELFSATFRPGFDGVVNARAGVDASAEALTDPYSLKARHLDEVRRRMERWRGPAAASDQTLHLYWSLYLGVLAWWAADSSPHQEDTLAVLDQALAMFVTSLPVSTVSETSNGL